MSGGELIKRLQVALRQKEIDTQHVRQLIRQLQAKEAMSHWLSLGVMVVLAIGLGVGVVLSIREVVVGA